MSKKVKTASEICGYAALLVDGERDRTHGDRATNLQNAADLVNAYLLIRKNPEFPLDAVDMAKILSLVKLARTESGEWNTDDYADWIGYAAIAFQLSHPEIRTRVQK